MGCCRGIALAYLLLAFARPATAEHMTTVTAVDDLARQVETVRRNLDIPAVALVMTDANRTLLSIVTGSADRSRHIAATGGTLFRIGSVTKMFTAMAVLMAVEDGSLSLDQPAREIADDFPVINPWQESHPIRLAHLLEHTAGLPDLGAVEFDHNEPLELGAALAWKAAERRCLWPPGMHYSYTNAGPGLAAWLLQRATGTRYEDFVQRRLLQPLGMHSASFFADRGVLAALARGYDADGHTEIPYWHMIFRPFGALNVRPDEMAPFLRLLLNRGSHDGRRLLSPAAITRMETPRTTLAARAGLRYGYGLGNYTWLHRGVLFHGHGGDADGYLARLGYSRDRGLAYLVVINVFRNGDLQRLQDLVEDYIVGDTEILPPPVAPIPAPQLEALAGSYHRVTRRFPTEHARAEGEPVKVTVVHDHLRVDNGSTSTRLFPVSARLFRQEHETVPTAAFIDDGGRLYLQYEAGNLVRRELP